MTVSWDSGHAIVDLESPPVRFDETAPSSTWQYNLVDGTAPVVAGTSPTAGISVRQLSQIEVTFSEGVLGVDAADLLMNGVPASAVSVTGSGRYLFSFTPPAAGAVQVAWVAGHGIRDFASPANQFAGGLWSYTLDPNLGLAKLRINEFTTSNVIHEPAQGRGLRVVPQSTIRQVASLSTSSALPALPLPSDAKRITATADRADRVSSWPFPTCPYRPRWKAPAP